MVRTAAYRASKYSAKLIGDIHKNRADKYGSAQKSTFKLSQGEQINIERVVKTMTHDLNLVYYILFAKKIVSLSKQFSAQTLCKEISIAFDKWFARGLNFTLLMQIRTYFAPTCFGLYSDEFINEAINYWGFLSAADQAYYNDDIDQWVFWCAKNIAIVPSANLRALWHYNQQTWVPPAFDIIDTSGNANHQRAINGASIIDGGLGRTANFDGVNQAMIAFQNVSLKLTPDASISAYVKFTSLLGAGTVATIYNKGNQGNNTHIWLMWHRGGAYWAFEGGNGIIRDSVRHIHTPTLGQWYHIVGTYESATEMFRLYLDGDEVNNKHVVGMGALVTDVLHAYTGGYRGVGHYLTGDIDELALWARCLSPAEIQAIYQRILDIT